MLLYINSYSLAAALLRLLSKYRPETPKQRKERLRQAAQDAAEGKKVEQEKIPAHLVYGINEVVKAVEQKRAKLVVISHDVNPIEVTDTLNLFLREVVGCLSPYFVPKDECTLYHHQIEVEVGSGCRLQDLCCHCCPECQEGGEPSVMVRPLNIAGHQGVDFFR